MPHSFTTQGKVLGRGGGGGGTVPVHAHDIAKYVDFTIVAFKQWSDISQFASLIPNSEWKLLKMGHKITASIPIRSTQIRITAYYKNAPINLE